MDYEDQADIVSDQDLVKIELLKNLSATDHNSIDQNLGTDANRSDGTTPKWNVTISKPDGAGYEESAIYPTEQSSNGYNVTITVTDESGNTSAVFNRELKVGDTKAPVFTMIGKNTIHDFYRYGENSPDLSDSQLLHADQIASSSNPSYDGTGEFSGGAHRLILADYNFTDPGIYAEDSSFDLTEYPDFDGDGIGEAHAIEKVTTLPTDAEMLNKDPGIIYSSSTLHTKSLKELQEDFDVATIENTTANIPDVTVDNFSTLDKNSTEEIKIKKIEIKYKVKDGWDQISETIRTVYIYESRQFANRAFYATPYRNNDNLSFTDLDDLSAAEKDYRRGWCE